MILENLWLIAYHGYMYVHKQDEIQHENNIINMYADR